ncbi:MAG: Asp-tRNA(Asn)/Glu-tRNA(Gln) amidotransferase subunit GatA [Myxococcota bacterium]|nr:Asp-tRNA(Asn)/Glu-tRNA(Gln) amidotransferase subunit GatA [Myxococcota bacterium]
MVDILEQSLEAACQQIRCGAITSLALVSACLEKVQDTKDSGCFLHVSESSAIQAATQSDQRHKNRAPKSILDGVPIGLKDIFITRDAPTTCASRLLEGYIPPYDSTIVAKLREAGAIILGKLNMDEFAMGSSNEFSAYQPVRNPHNPDKVAGGSSGGSAAAVANHSVFAALGTDTGGSIRQPAAFCGTVGLKPTYGRVSRFGMIAFASSLDQAGPLTRTVRDNAIILQAIAGYDDKDSSSVEQSVPDYLEGIEQGVQNLRVGIPREYFEESLPSAMAQALAKTKKSLEEQGAELIDISLPHSEYGIATYYLLATAEASSNLARFDGVRYGNRVGGDDDLHAMYQNTRSAGFGPEVKRRIMLGTYALSAGYYDAYYLKAQKVRTLICQDFRDAFSQVDVILTPTTPTTAFGMGEQLNDPLAMYLSDIFTVNVNLAGLPAMALPIGFDEDNLPLSCQLIGRPWDESTLLGVARSIEKYGGGSI